MEYPPFEFEHSFPNNERIHVYQTPEPIYISCTFVVIRPNTNVAFNHDSEYELQSHIVKKATF